MESEPNASVLKEIIIYTDGACLGNPGPGGYGAVVIYKDHRRELSQGYVRSTNNRMEIRAAIAALKILKERCSVTLYSDSQYLVRGIDEGWAERWRANGWRRNAKETASNPDLWTELLDLCSWHEVKFVWVRGHSGNRDNEFCDRLANSAYQQGELIVDDGYEDAPNGRLL